VKTVSLRMLGISLIAACLGAPLKADESVVDRSVHNVGQHPDAPLGRGTGAGTFLVDVELPSADVVSPSDLGRPGLQSDRVQEKGRDDDRLAIVEGATGDVTPADLADKSSLQASFGPNVDITALGSEPVVLGPSIAVTSPTIRMYFEEKLAIPKPKLEYIDKEGAVEPSERPHAFRPLAPKLDRPKIERPSIEHVKPKLVHRKVDIAPRYVVHKPRMLAVPKPKVGYIDKEGAIEPSERPHAFRHRPKIERPSIEHVKPKLVHRNVDIAPRYVVHKPRMADPPHKVVVRAAPPRPVVTPTEIGAARMMSRF
jgi:hypothetical protein